ncbi:uncharacterized protein L3040_001330 [Drepanopeziza brunnea f. sp. 'multigermtubi']|uniref:Putative Vacuolar fusion protein CCZ1 n=1 Tax=Marssonina brunnea f. sp. multigermtubi (strain MB_m1) TaxID=1072389 RepID=K1X7G3_MARBU|nr:putative Vacuolar fusion protein CCZ1 [Drepanopeziza brunnea f. sp. 'multigermtubi' MB_m1]EKD16588.1 putative Vacuolar fusion protein CCZ1 [Drepanopeziza brunnea f. sp. 'multigermtubi' MB_m1]KAJ5051554.1 hypothetical protein L3040_001330 [Drepanopeziza brunnea f. sp. 'multigermtubi']
MSSTTENPRRAVPAQLGFLAIYNPSLGATDETVKDQIVYYSTPGLRGRSQERSSTGNKTVDDDEREQNNEQLRQVGLAQGMVEFGRSFSDGRAVDTVETEKSRIVLHELESGWWILASINLTVLPTAKAATAKGKETEPEPLEYSSREVKPAILLLGDLLRAHSTFLLHHASSMSALFVRYRRSKFVGILGRYWDTFLTTWNVLMHGNPANNLYGGIKIAACGELGVGVGEEERGSGEREVLEGFVGRLEGLVDVIVSKFGEADDGDTETSHQKDSKENGPTEPWLGSGNEPNAEDGAIFLGTGALSRKSLRDVSHWIEDLYKWGPYAYGVIDNPSSNRRSKKMRKDLALKRAVQSPDKKKARQVYGLTIRDKIHRESPLRHESPLRPDLMTAVPPMPVNDSDDTAASPMSNERRTSLQRGPSSFTGSESDSPAIGNRLVQYLKFGYGTHWSLGSTPNDTLRKHERATDLSKTLQTVPNSPGIDGTTETSTKAGSSGHFLIGLLGNIDEDDIETSDVNPEGLPSRSEEDLNSRLLLRTLTLELERDEDARVETEISIDLGARKQSQSTVDGSEHTGTSKTSFESQDRNKTKKLRVVVYVKKPFVFVFLFELRSDALAMTSLYRSLHHQISSLIKPLLLSTAYRASMPEVSATDESTTPIYDLVWDPKLLTVNSTIPNIPDPLQPQSSTGSLPWSRIDALNTHMQIVNTYVATTTDSSSVERTCKTSRGWWVVWTKIPDPDPPEVPSSLERGVPSLVKEDSTESQMVGPLLSTQGTSTFGASIISGPAHPFLENTYVEFVPKDKEIFLIRRASDHAAARFTSRFPSGSSMVNSEAGWTSGPGKLAQGIGVDTRRYIEGLLNLHR